MRSHTLVLAMMVGMVLVAGGAVALPGLSQAPVDQEPTAGAGARPDEPIDDRLSDAVIDQATHVLEQIVEASWHLYRRAVQPKLQQLERAHQARHEAARLDHHPDDHASSADDLDGGERTL